MNSNVALALFSKFKFIYESDDKPDTFLAFTLGRSIGVTAEQFELISQNKTDTGDDVRALHLASFDFSQQINQGALLSPLFLTANYTVDKVVTKIVNEGIFSLSHSELFDPERLKELNSVLYDSGLLPTPAYAAYIECQANYYQAQNNFRNNGQDPLLKQTMDNAMVNWIANGNKNLIENTVSEILAIGAQVSPLKYQSDIASLLALSVINDPMAFYPATFSPMNFYEGAANWTTLTFNSEDEIDSFCQQAPDELKALISAIDDTAARKILSLSVEVTRVDVNRSWFDEEIFKKRFWKFNDGTVLSEGGTTSKGDFPAYIKGFIACRNLTINYIDNETGSQSVETPTRFIPELIKKIKLEILPVINIPGSGVVDPARDGALLNNEARTPFSRPGIRPDLAVGSDFIRTPVTRAFSGAAIQNQRSFFQRPQFFQSNSTPENNRILNVNYIVERPQSNIPVTEISTTSEAIEIIAVVCKKIPKCPDPDGSLF